MRTHREEHGAHRDTHERTHWYFWVTFFVEGIRIGIFNFCKPPQRIHSSDEHKRTIRDGNCERVPLRPYVINNSKFGLWPSLLANSWAARGFRKAVKGFNFMVIWSCLVDEILGVGTHCHLLRVSEEKTHLIWHFIFDSFVVGSTKRRFVSQECFSFIFTIC